MAQNKRGAPEIIFIVFIGSTLNYHPETNTIYLFGGFKEGFFDAEVYRVQLQNEWWVWEKVEIPEMSIKPSGRYIHVYYVSNSILVLQHHKYPM